MRLHTRTPKGKHTRERHLKKTMITHKQPYKPKDAWTSSLFQDGNLILLFLAISQNDLDLDLSDIETKTQNEAKWKTNKMMLKFFFSTQTILSRQWLKNTQKYQISTILTRKYLSVFFNNPSKKLKKTKRIAVGGRGDQTIWELRTLEILRAKWSQGDTLLMCSPSGDL